MQVVRAASCIALACPRLKAAAVAMQVFTQSFKRGVPTGPLQQRKRPAGDCKESGTTVRFLYDQEIFTAGCAFMFRLCCGPAFLAIPSLRSGKWFA